MSAEKIGSFGDPNYKFTKLRMVFIVSNFGFGSLVGLALLIFNFYISFFHPKEFTMKIAVGIVLMICSTLMMMKYLTHLKKEMKKDGTWLVLLREMFHGASALIIIVFMIGLLLVITSLKQVQT